jgi:ribose/xylose/arabinose/galactoside ABC-type transport system permease subunit
MAGSFFRKHGNEIGLLIAIIVVVLVTATIDPAYRLKPKINATAILRQTSLLGIFALGAAVVIISGGIDLSSGSVIAFSGTIWLSILYVMSPVNDDGLPAMKDFSHWMLFVSILGTLLAALLVGSFHAWLITVVGLPPFVATLASLVGLRSLAQVVMNNVTKAVAGQPSTQIYLYDKMLLDRAGAWWMPLVVFLVLAFVLWVLLSRTVLGRRLYAMGGNEQAARLSGIRTDRLKWVAYCIGSVTAAIAGILLTCYSGMAQPSTQGAGEELNAIACAVVGGVSLQGGLGTIGGTMLGALFLRVVIDFVAKVIKTNSDEFQGLIVGVLVVLAVAFNEIRRAGGLKRKFFPGWLGTVNIAILSLLLGTVTGLLASNHKATIGVITGIAVLGLLSLKKWFEVQADKRLA